MGMIVLSNRLKTLADMLTPVKSAADVGCDHGFVSIYLIQQKRAARVYAMDVRPGPLSRAEAHVKEQGLTNYIELRLSDGVSALHPGEAEALICAGMGGKLMVHILNEGREKVCRMKELILQPQSEIGMFRRYLRENGYHITAEEMVWEDGKYYPMIKAVPDSIPAFKEKAAGQEKKEELEDKFGRLLIKDRHPVLRSYLQESINNYKEICQKLEAQKQRTDKSRMRLEAIQSEIADMRTVLAMMEE